jgi:hypothetical protein
VRLTPPLARLFIVALLVATTIALVPLAYADPPDPLWIGGYWDDDDYDNVVIAATSTVALHDGPSVDVIGPVLVVVGTAIDTASAEPRIRPSSSHQPRSPPTP